MAKQEDRGKNWADRRIFLPVYTYVAAGRYAETNPANVRNWFRGQDGPGHKMAAVFDRIPRHGLSYMQLVEVAFVANMRRRGLHLDEMRRAYTFVRQKMGIDYPFAQERFKTDGMELYIEAYGKLVNAGRDGQIVIREALDASVGQLEYADEIAARWFPRGRERPISIDPRVSFGRPTIAGTGIPTLALAGCFLAGDTVDSLAHDYQLSLVQVEEALRFELRNQAA